jgi:hypothetical protein
MTSRPSSSADEGTPTVTVVLSGAAARGAFQAGALAELIPALERDGLTPTVWLGTSAGSINAFLWGSAAHLGAETAAEEVLGVWREMNDDDVYRGLLPFSLARTGLQYAAGAVLGMGSGTTSLLDTTPLRRAAAYELRTGQLAANVADGVLAAVGVVATRMPAESDSSVVGAASGRSVLFLAENSAGDYTGDPDRALDVVRGPLTLATSWRHRRSRSRFPRSRSQSPTRPPGGTWTAGSGSTHRCIRRWALGHRGFCSSRRLPRPTVAAHCPTLRAGHLTSPTRPRNSCTPPSPTVRPKTSVRCVALTGWWARHPKSASRAC